MWFLTFFPFHAHFDCHIVWHGLFLSPFSNAFGSNNVGRARICCCFFLHICISFPIKLFMAALILYNSTSFVYFNIFFFVCDNINPVCHFKYFYCLVICVFYPLLRKWMNIMIYASHTNEFLNKTLKRNNDTWFKCTL